MRLVAMFAVVAISLGAAVFVLCRSSCKVWSKEPKTYLGIALGKPISDSLPACSGEDDVRRCYDGEYIDNAPPALGLTQIKVSEGIVVAVVSTYSPDERWLISEDLRARFGEPSSGGDTQRWEGRSICLTFAAPIKDGPGLLEATLNSWSNMATPPHSNPF